MPTNLRRARTDVEFAMTDEAQFVADTTLGKLTKWLRVMGIGVMYDPGVINAQLLQCVERLGRILLTRDGGLLRRRGPAQRLYIESAHYHEQVRQVIQAFRLGESIQIFSRCLQCMAYLGAIAKGLVAARARSYVHASQMTFKHGAIGERLYGGGRIVIACSDNFRRCSVAGSQSALRRFVRPVSYGAAMHLPTMEGRGLVSALWCA